MFEIFDCWELKRPLGQLKHNFCYDQFDALSEAHSFSHIKRTPFPYFIQANEETLATAGRLVKNRLVNHLEQFENRCTQHSTSSAQIFDHNVLRDSNFSDIADEIPCSIVISHLEKNHYTLGKTSYQLAEKYRIPIGVNAYITPPHSKTFNCHFDLHDIIVLHLFGKKRWNIYKHKTSPEDAAEILLEVELSPGDILFVPEGYYHEAVSLDSLSLHLSLGLYETSPSVLIEWLKKYYPHSLETHMDKEKMINFNFLYQFRHQRVNQHQNHFLVFENTLEKRLTIFTWNKEIHLSLDLKEWLHKTLTATGIDDKKLEREDLRPLARILSEEIKRY